MGGCRPAAETVGVECCQVEAKRAGVSLKKFGKDGACEWPEEEAVEEMASSDPESGQVLAGADEW